jgi:hypothetical protein
VVFDKKQLGIPNTLDPSSTHDETFLKFMSTNTDNPYHSLSSDSLPCSSSPLLSNNPQSLPDVPLFLLDGTLPPITFPSLSDPSVTLEASQSTASQPAPSHPLPTQLLPQPQLPASQPQRRSSRFCKQLVKLDEYILSLDHDDFDIYTVELDPELSGDNLTYDQAAHHPSWKDAMHDEIRSILKNQTWDLAKLPPSKRAITAKWVYKKKPALLGQASRLKARLVAQGFQQRHDIDYEETFVPVVKWSTIHALTA